MKALFALIIFVATIGAAQSVEMEVLATFGDPDRDDLWRVMEAQDVFTDESMLLVSGWILASTAVIGGLFEGRQWARPAEAIRLLLGCCLLVGVV